MDDEFYNRVNGDRISSRQVDELIGISRGMLAEAISTKLRWISCRSGLQPTRPSATNL